jgi:hypothetical protein
VRRKKQFLQHDDSGRNRQSDDLQNTIGFCQFVEPRLVRLDKSGENRLR